MEKVEATEKTEEKVEKQKKVVETAKNKVALSHILRPIYFIIFAILLEMVNFLWLRFTVTGNSSVLQVLPKYFFLDIGVYLIIAGTMFMVSRKWANALLYIFLGFQLAINMINATLYKVFGDIFSFDMMLLGHEAAQAFKFEFIDFYSILVNLAILGCVITLQVLLDRKLKVEFEMKKFNKQSLLLVVFFSCYLAGFGSFGIQTANFYDTDTAVRISESDQYLWDNMHFKLEAYKKFGTYGFYIKSISNLIYKNDHFDDNKKNDLLFDLADGEQEKNVSAKLYGDNLIVVMLESFEWFAIDPFNTPTLWDLRKNSAVSMENYYSKNKTNVSEDICLLGHMPKDVSMSHLAKNGKLSTPYTLPNLFKEQGYQTNFFHSYKKTFYDRDIINKAMGFDNVYGIEDADVENKSLHFNDWNLDSDVAAALIDEIIPETGKFFSFFTTVTTHGSYNRTNSRFENYYQTYDNNLSAYKEWLATETSYVYPEDKTLEKCYRQYKCAAMDTDRMIKLLLDNLQEKGLSENTTLVLYADHNCYYEDIYFNLKGTSKADYYDIYNYNVPLMIYSPKLTPRQNTEFCNTYDLYPTICSLFGLPFNTALTQGYNIFSKSIKNSVMVSYLTGAFNKDFYTLNIVDMHASPLATQDDLNRFKRNACKFYEKLYNIDLYYKYIF